MSMGRALFWAILALPAALMAYRFSTGAELAMDLLHPTGEMAIRLMILALLPGPLTQVFGRSRFLDAWLSVRRNLGVGAFCYALLHLAFYLIDMRVASAIIGELTIPGIWTGWLAFTLLAVPASLSFDRAMRKLGRRWKQAQRLAYGAAIVTIIHWLLLDWEWIPAVLHLAPLVAVWGLRALSSNTRKRNFRT